MHVVDDCKTLDELLATHLEYQDKTLSLETLVAKHLKISSDIQMLYQAHESFKELVKVFEEQLTLHRNNSKKAQAHEQSKWVP